MVARPFRCDRNRLRLLLEERLAGEGQAEVERHLETCDHCRKHLETLAAEEQWWTEVREFLHPDTNGPATTPPIDGRASGLSKRRGSADEELPLDFLSPSDNPAMLGRLGRYEIAEVIGRGGMGIVLKGFDRELNRYAAIKVLAPHLATSAAARQRFAREARAAAAVVHEHVVAIHNVETAGPLPYLVMSYVHGESLQDRLDRSGPLELKEILRIGMQVAQGLAAAHAQGLVHRDIKPANILLENGVERVKITDFGLARAIDDATLTRSGIVAGTPEYMAPEQARGEAVDPRCDLFSLGSVMYAMCTGRAPFRAEGTLAMLRRICEDTPRPIREITPEIPDWLAAIVARLHAKKPEERFQTAGEAAELLGRFLAHLQQPTVVPMPKFKYGSSTQKSRRRRIGWAAAVLSLVLAGVYGMIAFAPWTWLTNGRSSASQEQTSSDHGKTTSPEASPRIDWTLVEWDPLQPEIDRLQSQSQEIEARLRESSQSPSAMPASDPLWEIRMDLERLEGEQSPPAMPAGDPLQEIRADLDRLEGELKSGGL